MNALKALKRVRLGNAKKLTKGGGISETPENALGNYPLSMN